MSWYPPLRILILHDAGETKSTLQMSASSIMDLAFKSNGVVLLTYAGLR